MCVHQVKEVECPIPDHRTTLKSISHCVAWERGHRKAKERNKAFSPNKCPRTPNIQTVRIKAACIYCPTSFEAAPRRPNNISRGLPPILPHPVFREPETKDHDIFIFALATSYAELEMAVLNGDTSSTSTLQDARVLLKMNLEDFVPPEELEAKCDEVLSKARRSVTTPFGRSVPGDEMTSSYFTESFDWTRLPAIVVEDTDRKLFPAGPCCSQSG